MKNKKLIAIMTLVCFMLTLMPVAAFAAIEDPKTIDEQRSYVYLNDTKADENEAVEVEFSLDYLPEKSGKIDVYVWFEEDGRANVPVTSLYQMGMDGKKVTTSSGIFTVNVADNDTEDFYFDRAGDYVVHASTVNPEKIDENTWAGKIAEIADYELNTTSDDTVVIEEDTDSDDYILEVQSWDDKVYSFDSKDGKDGLGKHFLVDDDTLIIKANEADGAYTYDVKFKLFESYETDKDGNVIEVGDEVYEEVDIDTTSGVTVTDLEVKRSGIITFDFTANKTGTHKIYIDIDGFEVTIEVDANEGEADEIEIAYVSKNAINIENAKPENGLLDYIEFDIYDEKGDDVEACDKTDKDSGVYGAMNSDSDDEKYKNYVMLTDKPADSDLESEDFYLMWYELDPESDTAKYLGKAADNFSSGWTIAGPSKIDEEGTYKFKVVLDNGDSVSFSLTFQEFDEPVALRAVYHTNNVVLGGTIEPRSIVRVDANGVTETVWSEKRPSNPLIGDDEDYEVRFAATGAAIEKVNGVKITVKDDEDYVGSTIKVSVVDTENDLVASTVLTVVDEAAELAFSVDSIPVDTTKTVTVTLVDENGKAVALNNVTTPEAYVVVLDKPAGADVDVEVGTTKDIAKKGKFDFTINSDTAGVVTVQAMMEMTADGVVRYYSGIGEIQVGGAGIEDTVVMSIGANKIVVNDEVVAIDAAPMIQDSRTFVPFRALAEAFGATVNYDAATQSITAELNGVTVVMTVGDEAYTVNGAAQEADVAPFINASRTMVPVRFVAEAFGISVTPIYAEDGAVADVLFSM